MVALVCVAVADRATYDETKTQMALPMDTPPVIDGLIEAEEWIQAFGAQPGGANSFWWVSVNEGLEDFIQGGSTGDVATAPFDNEDLSFEIWVGYDSDNLYVAIRVSDYDPFDDSAEAGSANGSTWLDDSVEVFVDGDNSNFPDRDTTGSNWEVVDTGGQYVITINNAYREAEAGNPGYGEDAAWYAMTELSDTGYEAEFRISMSTIGNPQRGDIIGFTVGVNDDDDGGGNDYQVMWCGMPHTEATYGNLVLGPMTYVAPKTSAPTIDGVISAGEYDGAEEIKVNPYSAMYDLRSGDDTWEPGDCDYSAWVIHDGEAVYVALDVTDDIIVNDSAEPESEDGSTWQDDSVEIFFDADNSNDSGRGSGQFEGQYVFTANGAWRDNEANNPFFGEADDWFAATSTTATGYQIEFKVLKSALFDPVDGTVMGFNICGNDDDGADRKSQPNWCGRAHNELTYADLTLAAEGPVPVSDWSIY